MKVGILVGRETGFPEAFIDAVNARGAGVTAEMIRLEGTSVDDTIPYRVILDRMSHEVPYYRAYVKKAVADGAIVINNPFWWSADDKFFECVLAEKIGVAVPKTVVLPNKAYEADVIPASLRNLGYPIDWDGLVEKVGGYPVVLKPAVGGGWKNVSIVRSRDDLLRAYDASGSLLMIMQEFIAYENYVRCFVIGRKHVRVARYEPSLSHFERWVLNDDGLTDGLRERIVQDCLALNRGLGYDMNTVEFAIRGGIPYAIDFLNPAPDCDPESIKRPNFDWVLEHIVNLVVDYATGAESPIGETTDVGTLSWQRMINAAPAAKVVKG